MSEPAQVVYLPVGMRPFSPRYYVKIFVRQTLITLLIISFLGGLLTEVRDPFEFFGNISRSFIPSLVGLAGLEVAKVSTASFGLYAIFLLLYLRALLQFIPMTRGLFMYAAESWAEFGPPKKARHPRWLWMAGLFIVAALAVHFFWSFRSPTLWLNYTLNCMRLMTFYGMLASAMVCLALAYVHKRQWQSSPYRSARPKREKLAKVVELKPQRVMPDNKPKPNPNRPFYTAMAAELIQQCGRDGKAPDVESLTKALIDLQRVVSLTSGSSMSGLVIANKADQALQFFKAGKLKMLPNVRVAKKMFKSPRPGIVDDVAGELQALLEQD